MTLSSCWKLAVCANELQYFLFYNRNNPGSTSLTVKGSGTYGKGLNTSTHKEILLYVNLNKPHSCQRIAYPEFKLMQT